jgi:hypothetical protein
MATCEHRGDRVRLNQVEEAVRHRLSSPGVLGRCKPGHLFNMLATDFAA